jgi:hypothetical protein
MDIGLIKNADQSDVEQIIELARKFHAVSGYENIEFDEETVENLLIASIEQGLCLIGVVDGKIIGFLGGCKILGRVCICIIFLRHFH